MASRPATPLKAAFMPIAMAIGVAMLPGTAAAQATTGNGGLELCPGGVGGVGSSWGPLSSAVGIMDCSSTGENTSGMSFSLNNSAADNGAWGFNSNNITARVTGYDDGRLELKGLGGINMLNDVSMTGHKITDLAAGDVSSASTDAVNGQQLYQNTRYFKANSASSDPSTDAQATGLNSVAAGPSARALQTDSSAFGANAIALAPSSVALGAGSTATRADTVSVGYLSADGATNYTRQITNVSAGSAATDAVNVAQLDAAISSVNGGTGAPAVNAVVYDTSAANLITLKGATGTKITNLMAGDISSADSMEAVNGSQLFHTNQNVANVASDLTRVSGNLANVTNIVNNIVDNGLAGSPLVVTYDSASQDQLTLGGVGRATPVKLTNVAPGDISSADSTDAVNGGQLYETNQNLAGLAANVGALGESIYNSGVKYFHANSSLADSSADGVDSVAIGGAAVASAANSVALGSNSTADRANAVSVGAVGAERQIINVAQGTADNDAVNVAQLNAAIAGSSGTGSPNAVVYDSSTHDKLTLGGATTALPVLVTNLAAGQVASGSTDAVNGDQLYKSASGLASALGAGASVNSDGSVTAPDYLVSGTTYNNIGDALSAINTAAGDLVSAAKYVKVVSDAPAALASGSESVAIGGGAMATRTNTLAIGTGATAAFENSTAIGVNAIADASYTVSFGSKGAEMRLTHVANGVDSTDAVTMAQLDALQAQLTSSTTGGAKSMMQAPAAVLSYIAVSSNTTQGAATSASEDLNAMAIGPVASAVGEGALAVGGGALAGSAGSTAVGTAAGVASVNATAIGEGASVGALSDNSVSIGYNSRASSINSLALGGVASATSAGSVSIGYDSFVKQTATNSVALGVNATATAANSVAIGTGAMADRAGAVSVGNATRQSQIINVAAGTSSTDAVNVGQLSGVAAAIGGGATVNPDGSIKAPSFAIGGQTYANVGDALAATAGNSVQYDTPAHDKLTLGGTDAAAPAVTLSNVADGVGDSDAVNVGQLKQLGMNVDSSGNVTNSFVAYDDTTLNAITLKGTNGTTISNVKAGELSAASTEAVNGSQLFQTNANVANVAGNLADVAGNLANVAGNVTNVTNVINNIVVDGGGIKYFHSNSTLADSSATGLDAVAIGGAASATADNSVALGANSVADRANSVSVGAAGAERQIVNVANATNSTDAVNLSQLQGLGANLDSSGNVTNSFVAYDDTTLNAITLKGANGTTISNVKAGELSAASTEAVNGSQLFQTNANVANVAGNLADVAGNLANVAGNVTNVTNVINNIVVDGGGIKYFHSNSTLADSSATGLDAVAIGGAASATADNSVALGANSVADRANSVSVGAAGAERQIVNVANATNSTDAVNLSQLQALGANIDSNGSVTNTFLSYDDATKNKITLRGAGSTDPVLLTNVGTGQITASSSDAVNGAQLYSVAQSTAKALGGDASVLADGTVSQPSYVITGSTYGDVGSALSAVDGQLDQINTSFSTNLKYVKVVSNSAAAQASGTESIAIGGNAMATKPNSLAIGAGAYASFENSTALGVNATTDAENTLSIGSKGQETRITHVADGINATDAATVGQLDALQAQLLANSASTSGTKSMMQTSAAVLSYIAVSSKVVVGASTTASDDLNAMAIGPVASATGEGALAVGAGALAGSAGSTAVGTGAGVASVNATAIGEGATVGALSDNAVSIGYNARASAVNATALGTTASATSNGSVAIGYGSFAAQAATGGMALGLNSTVSAANGVAIGYGAIADRANAVSVGTSTRQSQIINVAAGTSTTDAVNLGQMTDAITAAVANVGGGGVSPEAVVYDTTSHDQLTLNKGGAAVTVSNVAAGVANNDAVNVSQLKAMGASFDTSGNLSNAFVAYDDTNKTQVTLGGTGATVPVVLANVGAGQVTSNSKQAINGSQLYGAMSSTAAALGGGSTVNSDGQVSKPVYTIDGQSYTGVDSVVSALNAKIGTGNLDGVAYDTSAHDSLTLGGVGSTTPVTVSNVASAKADDQAVNLKQLKDAGLSVDSSGNVTNSFVAYDDAGKTTLTLGGVGSTTPVTIANVAAATQDDEAVNLKQLKDAGLSVDSSGNVTSSFVSYDDAGKTILTFNPGSTATQLKNVAAGVDATDAVNVSQMQSYVSTYVNNVGGGGGTANAVAYDDASKSQVTLGGTGANAAVKLTNVAEGTAATDAVNFGQLSSLQSQVNNILTGAGSGGGDYVNVGAPEDGGSGTPAVASGSDAIAIGNGAAATGKESIAIGKSAVTAGDGSVAVGSGATAPNTNSVALGAGSTTDRDNSVSVGSVGAERQITNVAAGTQGTDAVNLNQLNSAMGNMSNSIHNVDRNAAKGIASASALNIVTPYLPGRTTINAGIANYRGFQAIGLGVSRWNEKGSINYNLGVSTSGGNSTIVRAGIGIVLGN